MWKFAGWFCVGLGAVGAVLPVMPTVPFLLLAAYCFEKGSPELHQWLMNHPVFGPHLRGWRQHGVIRPWAKGMATICILASVSFVLIYRDLHPGLKTGIAAGCVLILAFILTRPNYPRGDL